MEKIECIFQGGPLHRKQRTLPFDKPYWILEINGEWHYYRHRSTQKTRKGVKKGQPTKKLSTYLYDGIVPADSETIRVTKAWMEREGVEVKV